MPLIDQIVLFLLDLGIVLGRGLPLLSPYVSPVKSLGR